MLHNKIRALLKQKKLDALLLTKRDSFSWFTQGKSNFVLQTTDYGVAYLYVTDKVVTCITSSNEVKRFAEEEFKNSSVNIESCSWDVDLDDFTDQFLKGIVGSDDGREKTIDISHDLKELRSSLSETEQEKYYTLGQSAAKIVEHVCATCEPGMTEYEIASLVAQKCIADRINPVCLLVATDDRIDNYKHPIPTNKKLENTLMIVLGAERDGLNVSLTRFVSFRPLSEKKQSNNYSLAYIHASLINSTRVGASFSEIFKNLVSLYNEQGFNNEWLNHHQGGPTGYACRETIVTSRSVESVRNHQAFAWNPSLPGLKSEETIVVNGRNHSILTRTKDWPTICIQLDEHTFYMADVLIRNNSN